MHIGWFVTKYKVPWAYNSVRPVLRDFINVVGMYCVRQIVSVIEVYCVSSLIMTDYSKIHFSKFEWCTYKDIDIKAIFLVFASLLSWTISFIRFLPSNEGALFMYRAKSNTFF
jgi:hypothetical protein